MSYKILQKQTFADQEYKIIPIRYQDRNVIMKWRNDQMDILRQEERLTEEIQDKYFKEVVLPDFDINYPKQILFSYLKDEELIGYGGLVHLNWNDRRGEVSFLLETARNSTVEIFKSEFKIFLKLIKQVAFSELSLNKITTEAYDLRPYLIEALESNDFIKEGILRSHYLINNKLTDALLHACFNRDLQLTFRNASKEDLQIVYDWINEKTVRENSFSKRPITLEEHKTWFYKKLNKPEDSFLIFSQDEKDVGYIRFDKENDHLVISVLVDQNYRGGGMGVRLIVQGLQEIRKKTDLPVFAYIKEENEASIRSFVKSGFKFEKELDINDETAKLYVCKN